MLIAVIIVTFFQGMIIIFDDADKTNLDAESQELYDTLVAQVDESSFDNTNFTRDNPQISDENAFSAEFFTASTSNQNKINQLDTVKTTPQLLFFAAGQQDDFGWFYSNVWWVVSFLIVIIGFKILFRREVD